MQEYNFYPFHLWKNYGKKTCSHLCTTNSHYMWSAQCPSCWQPLCAASGVFISTSSQRPRETAWWLPHFSLPTFPRPKVSSKFFMITSPSAVGHFFNKIFSLLSSQCSVLILRSRICKTLLLPYHSSRAGSLPQALLPPQLGTEIQWLW